MKRLLFLFPLFCSAQVQTIPNTTFPAVRSMMNSNFSWINSNKAPVASPTFTGDVMFGIAVPGSPSGSVALSLRSKLGERVSVMDFGCVGDGVADDTTCFQDAIASGIVNIYVPPSTGSYYRITQTLEVSSRQAFRLYGAGSTSEATSASRIHWAGAANGTIIRFLSCNDCGLDYITLDSVGTSAGIGLDVTGINASGAAHAAKFEHLAIWNITGTPGYSIRLGSATNDDIASNLFRHINMQTGGGATCIYQEGTQTVNNHFEDIGCFAYASKGIVVVAGDLRLNHGNFFGAATATTDVEVGPLADWVTIRDSYHELNTRSVGSSVYSFPAGARSYPTKLDGVRAQWNLASGSMISYLQQGPLTVSDATFDGAGVGLITVNNGSSSLQPTRLDNVYLGSGMGYSITGNTVASLSPGSGYTAWSLIGSTADNTHYPCQRLQGGTLATAYPQSCAGNGGYALQLQGGAAPGVPAAFASIDSGAGTVSLGIGSTAGITVTATSVSAVGGSATKITCWKSDGHTLGYATMSAGNISACN